MTFELFLSRRLSRSNLNRNYYSGPITNICISAISISIIIIVIAIGCGEGLELTIKKRILDVESAIQIKSINHQNNFNNITLSNEVKDSILNINGVKNLHPIISKPCIISYNDNIEGVILKGIDSTYKTKTIHNSIVNGKYMETDQHILISKKQSEKFSLSIGEKCTLYFVTKKNNIIKRKFIISGIFDLNNEQFNEYYILARKDGLMKINNWTEFQAS